jgi:predicted transglutaminase-like cysteine proteinase
MARLLIQQNLVKLFIILFVILLISAAEICPQTIAQTDSSYNKHFEWDYKGQHWTWNLSIPVEVYSSYKAVPVSNRTQNGPSGYGFCTTTEDTYVQSLAKELNNTSNQLNYGAFDKVSFILAFVQSLPYTSDSVTTGHDEYPRFPIETLVDDGGDCEDSAILFASLTLIMGFDTVYINPPGHYAVGILGDNLRGTYWTYPEGSNQTYYYCETTGNGFMIGELPTHFLGQSVNIYSINESKQFIPPVSQTILYPDSTDSMVTLPKTTVQPTPVSTSTIPTVSQPSSEPFLTPISINVVYDNPLLYILGLLSMIIIIGYTIVSVKPKIKQKKTTISIEKAAQLKQVD